LNPFFHFLPQDVHEKSHDTQCKRQSQLLVVNSRAKTEDGLIVGFGARRQQQQDDHEQTDDEIEEEQGECEGSSSYQQCSLLVDFGDQSRQNPM